jgi:formylglycine-generating enzyme required for sulfatase activity
MNHTLDLILALSITAASFAQTKIASLKPGQTFKDCKDCPEMVIISAGSFMIGATENEPGSYPEEKPQHRVTIQQFACAKFDITKKDWAVFVKETSRPQQEDVHGQPCLVSRENHRTLTPQQTGIILCLQRTVPIPLFASLGEM